MKTMFIVILSIFSFAAVAQSTETKLARISSLDAISIYAKAISLNIYDTTATAKVSADKKFCVITGKDFKTKQVKVVIFGFRNSNFGTLICDTTFTHCDYESFLYAKGQGPGEDIPNNSPCKGCPGEDVKNNAPTATMPHQTYLEEYHSLHPDYPSGYVAPVIKRADGFVLIETDNVTLVFNPKNILGTLTTQSNKPQQLPQY